MVTLLALLGAILADGAAHAARADDAEVVATGRTGDGDVVALVHAPGGTAVDVSAVARAGTTILDARTSPLMAADRPVILVIDAGGASTPAGLRGLQSLAGDLLLRIGASAPVTVVATGSSPVVLATGSDAVATRIDAVNKLRLLQARSGGDELSSAVQAGLLETADATGGRTVVVLEGPATAGSPEQTNTLGHILATGDAIPLVATPAEHAASWAGLVERSGGQLVAAPLADWSATSKRLATTLTTSISVEFPDPGATARLSVVVRTGAQQRVLAMTLPGQSPGTATKAHRRSVWWPVIGAGALLLLLAAAALIALTRRPRRGKRHLLPLSQHAPRASRPNMLRSRPRHLDGHQAPDFPRHERAARTARVRSAQAGHRRSGAMLHAGVQPRALDETTQGPLVPRPEEAGTRDYAGGRVTPEMPAPRAMPTTTTGLGRFTTAEPATVVAQVSGRSTSAEPAASDEPGSREPHGLIQSVDEWRTAGSSGDLATLLDGLAWLQESWPSPSSYEGRLQAALRTDLQRVGKQYAEGEISTDKGYEAVSGVVQVIDALWENRSAMPPVAAETMSTAAQTALAHAQAGNSTQAFELLDVLSTHWNAVQQEQSGNDAVRIALLDVSAFWSASFPDDSDSPRDLLGFESLVEHVDQLFAVRAATAARQGEALQRALTALLARWQRTDGSSFVTQNDPGPIEVDEITPNLREDGSLGDDES